MLEDSTKTQCIPLAFKGWAKDMYKTILVVKYGLWWPASRLAAFRYFSYLRHSTDIVPDMDHLGRSSCEQPLRHDAAIIWEQCTDGAE